MFVRTTHDVYLEKAAKFIEQVVNRVKDLQFFTTKGPKGGPIIMTQVRKRSHKDCCKKKIGPKIFLLMIKKSQCVIS